MQWGPITLQTVVEVEFSEVRLHDLPAVRHAADEKLLEGELLRHLPLLYAMHGAI